MFSNPVPLIVLAAAGIIGLTLLVKSPEFFVALLLIGPGYIRSFTDLFGIPLSRRTFETSAALIFIPIVMLILILRMVQVREREPIIGRPNWPFVIGSVVMGLVFLVGLSYTDAQVYGPWKTRDYFVFGMAPMLLAFIFLRDRASVHRLLMWIMVVSASCVVLMSAYSLATRGTIFTQMMFIVPSEELGVRARLLGHGALSSPVVIALASALALAAGHKRFLWKLLPVVLLPIVFLYVILAGTRSNLVAFLFMATVGFFVAYKGHRGAFVVALVVFLVVGGLLATYAPEEVRDRMMYNWFQPGTQAGGSGYARINNILTAPGYFIQSPLIGSGTGSWTVLDVGFDIYNYPHNMFVEVAVENGIVGLAVLLSLWGIIFRCIWRHLRTAEHGTELFGLAVFGACLLAVEFTSSVSHFGLAHHSCTFLMTSAITLRATYLAEQAQSEEVPASAGEEAALPAAEAPLSARI
jgi:O-antigen ligase